jgi:cyclic pyranopterin phosphate synthase
VLEGTDLSTRVKMRLMRWVAAYHGRWRTCPVSSVAIETSQHCNRRCSYCPVSVSPKAIGTISEPLFNTIVDQLDLMGFRGTLKYHFFNEPLLNMNLERLVGLAHARLPKVRHVIYTNGDALSEARATSLLAAGVRKFVITDHGHRRLTSFVSTADARIHWPWSRTLVRRITNKTFLFNRGGLISVARSRQFSYCSYPAYEAVIDMSGNVLMCCNDYHGEQAFGNVLETPLVEIWRSSSMTRARKELLSGVFRSRMCQSCVTGTLAVGSSRTSAPRPGRAGAKTELA